MGNMLKGLAEMLSQNGNIIDALTNSQAIAGAQPAFDVSKTGILGKDGAKPSASNSANPDDVPNFATSQKSPAPNSVGYPELEYSEWSSSEGYRDEKYYYGDWFYYRYVGGIWVVSHVVDSWYTQEFQWYSYQQKKWSRFVPNGYYKPEEVYKSYADGLAEFGDVYQIGIYTAISVFSGTALAGTFGVTSAAARAYLCSSLKSAAVEFFTDLAVEKGKLPRVDYINVASNFIPGGKYKLIFKSCIDALADYKEIRGSNGEVVLVWPFSDNPIYKKPWNEVAIDGILSALTSYLVGKFRSVSLEGLDDDKLAKNVMAAIGYFIEYTRALIIDGWIDTYKNEKRR
jgi:hypothetical protein